MTGRTLTREAALAAKRRTHAPVAASEPGVEWIAERGAEQAADLAADGAIAGERVPLAATAGGGSTPGDEPSEVDVLPGGGQPLDGELRIAMERSFGHDFAAVRVHASPAAAGRQGAAAYTIGEDIVVGTPDATPETAAGRWLYAHELAHVVQQRRSGVPAVQRIGVGEWFARLFGGGTFDTPELKQYLRYLDQHGEIEGGQTSDNKAREIVRRWRAGDPDFPEPSLPQKQLMLLEMIDGPTLDDDEHAILELLRGSSDAQVRTLLATAGGDEALGDEFHGSEYQELLRFLADFRSRPANRPVADAEVGRGRGKVAITDVDVNQETPQTVTLTYSDGRTESGVCSTGKGTCAVPAGGNGPTDAQTQQTDSNWTPNGTHRVQFKVEDHDGIKWWTQFNSRAIALHQYSPVDGTPLSHGCVRLHGGFAERIFRGALSEQEVGSARATRVRVHGTPQPRTSHSALVTEWEHDFSQGAGVPRDGGDRELRKHLRLAFGGPRISDAELDRRIAAGVIPTCGGTP
jgi:hypothetical protein